MWWQKLGQYEYEVGQDGNYTGWYRCVGGRHKDGRWPAWHTDTGAVKYC